MSPHVFGGTSETEISSQYNGTLVDSTTESVVHHSHQLVLISQFTQSLQFADLQSGVGGTLDPQQSSVPSDLLFDTFNGLCEIYEVCLDPMVIDRHSGSVSPGPPIHIITEQSMFIGTEQHQNGTQHSTSRRKSNRVFRVVQFRHCLAQLLVD